MTLDELACIDIALELFANGIATSAHQLCFADLVAGDDAPIARSSMARLVSAAVVAKSNAS